MIIDISEIDGEMKRYDLKFELQTCKWFQWKRLNKSLGITYEEWFETALRESEFDVLVRFLDNPEDQNALGMRKFVGLQDVLTLKKRLGTR